jgi:hypothetical protein
MNDDDGFWAREQGDADDAVAPQPDAEDEDAGEQARESGLTPDAHSLLADFAVGGLPGLMRGLQEQGDFEDDVDDPEALHRAEEAVAHDKPMPMDDRAPIDEDWARVAVQDGPGGPAGLQLVAGLLASSGVPFGWDPYDPADAVSFMWPGTETRVYALQVPVSQLGFARRVLTGAPPEGVRYTLDPGTGQSPAPDDDAGSAPQSFGPTTPTPTPITGYSPALSDNERLERMAGAGRSTTAIALAVGVGLFVMAIVLFVLLRG